MIRILAIAALAVFPAAGVSASPQYAGDMRLHAPTAQKSWSGRLLVPTSFRAKPARTARAVATLQPIAPLAGGATSLLVTGTRRVKGVLWVRMLLPVRPNGAQGWARADVFRFVSTRLRVLIDQSDRRLTVYRNGRVLMRVPVAIGKPSTPTPTGRFAIAEMIRTRTPGAFLGPIVFPLTGYSNVLNEFAGGNGRVAMHGTSLPHLIGTRASNGCIRIHNSNVVRISRLVRPGVPVTIRF
jgi:L,D-transpeptidase catalytic domain